MGKKRRQQQVKRIHINIHCKRNRQTGFLNRYDFAYAGRDVVNQAAKVTPEIIKSATNDVTQQYCSTEN